MAAFDDLVRAVEQRTGRQGRRNGRNIRLLCPAHDDHNPSLDIAEAADGSPLVTCRSCGATLEQVAKAIGHDPRDYLPVRPDDSDTWTPRGPAVAVYDYVDEKGALLFQVLRTADKQFPQRRPDPTAEHGWRWNLKGVRRVLYRLPQVISDATIGERIYIVEGEKDVHAVEKAGGTATCNPGGAGKWSDDYVPYLHGAEIYIVADRDETGIGIAHAKQIASSIAAHGNGTAAGMRILLPRAGKDVHDHLAAGHSLEDLEPLDETEAPPARLAITLNEFVRLELARPPALLGTEDDTLIPAGGLGLLAGMPGVGKTTLGIDLVFHLAAGQDWLNIPVPRPVNILVIENEGPQHKFQALLRRKLEAWPHDLPGQIHIQTWKWGAYTFRDDDHITLTRQYLDDHDIGLVMGDPLDTLGPEGVGSPENTREFAAALVPLGLTATRTFLFLHHFRKEVSLSEINQVSGAWGGRLDLLATLRATDRPDELRLAFVKARHGTDTNSGRNPIVVGRVHNTLSFDYLNEEVLATGTTAVDELAGQIIACLQKTGGTLERPTLAIRIETDPKSGTFNRAIGKLLNEGLLAKGQDGKKTVYSLTEESW